MRGISASLVILVGRLWWRSRRAPRGARWLNDALSEIGIVPES
jgi:hypothetical protein